MHTAKYSNTLDFTAQMCMKCENGKNVLEHWYDKEKEGTVKVKGWIKVVDHLMNSEFNDARSWEEVDSEAGVCCEDCCVVTENCQLWVAHPRYLGN